MIIICNKYNYYFLDLCTSSHGNKLRVRHHHSADTDSAIFSRSICVKCGAVQFRCMPLFDLHRKRSEKEAGNNTNNSIVVIVEVQDTQAVTITCSAVILLIERQNG